MMTGFAVGLVLGWLIAGVIVLSLAFKRELAGEPLGARDIPLILGAAFFWPLLLFPEEAADE